MENQSTHRGDIYNQRRTDGFTLVELLVVIAIIGTLAALFSPNILSALRKGDEVTCTNNLKNIGQACMAYAFEKRFFPYAGGTKPPAYMSLNKLIESNAGKDLTPEVFICPSSLDEKAETDSEGKFTMGETNNSYAYLGKKTKQTAPGRTPVCCDDSIANEDEEITENHDGFLMMFRIDGSVTKVDSADITEGQDLPGNCVGQEGGQ
ncbi:MAG: prepilin-type N-terminal cleavage/methylation domain-containing protein [Planctomycetota bacterium]